MKSPHGSYNSRDRDLRYYVTGVLEPGDIVVLPCSITLSRLRTFNLITNITPRSSGSIGMVTYLSGDGEVVHESSMYIEMYTERV